jgi:hypothetical protein
MAEAVQGPVMSKPVPPIITHVGASLGPIDLKELIKPAQGNGGAIRFSGELADGRALPDGIICTGNGLIAGIPAERTEGNYDLLITAVQGEGTPLVIEVKLTIKERLTIDDPFFFNSLKSQVWKALGDNLPIPEMGDLLNRPITAVEIYYLLQRFAVLTIWDVYNLEEPGVKTLLSLDGTNKHYHIYDRGSCLVAAPKDLFSHERTVADALDVSRTLAREVYKRGWTIEFAGFNKMVRAAWVELQHLGDRHGKKIEILHFVPSNEDRRAYTKQAQLVSPAPGPA